MGRIRRGSQLETVQTAAAVVAVGSLVLGFAASIGLRLVPTLAPAAFWPMLGGLALCGAGAGIATVVRGHQVDRVRWQVAQDPMVTSAEREYAHKEAERERRWAGTVFFVAPVALAYWVAYQLPPGSGVGASGLLALVPIAGYLVGLLAAHWRWRERPPE
jgi:MFS family permease